MDIDEIGGWQETWNEQLYKREYENLPDFMIDTLWEYFEDGGTADEFNDVYQFGTNEQDVETVRKLVETEYNEFIGAEDEDSDAIDIIVVTNPELGWDCVVGVFRNIEDAEAEYPEDEGYIHHDETLY